jgi:hydrogenase maturation protease
VSEILVFGYGNPGRGDDGIGLVFVERLVREGLDAAGDVECQTDMQLQVEHVTDLCVCRLALFVDADASCEAPYRLSRIEAAKDDSYTSHAMSPEALLYAYLQVYGTEPPPAFLLRIRGYGFELGEALGPQAESNLEAALTLVRDLCVDADPERWQRLAVTDMAVGTCD